MFSQISCFRERFGSHSPEEYMNLRISGFDDKLERDEIKEILTAEFRKFAPFEVLHLNVRVNCIQVQQHNPSRLCFIYNCSCILKFKLLVELELDRCKPPLTISPTQGSPP